MTRNSPTDFPSDESFASKWLADWNSFSANKLNSLDPLCQKFQDKAQQLSKSERKERLIRLIGLIDLTTLSGDDTPQRVFALVDKAVAPCQNVDSGVKCAAVCVYPARVSDVIERLASKPGSDVQVASVAGGFPSGQYRLESRLLEVKLAVQDGATEIDIVINRAAALTGQWRLVHSEVAAMRRECGEKAHLKTILATGELKDMKTIYQASMAAMLAGSDFIKTSTGKETVNATLPVAYVMCAAVKTYHDITKIKVGFKPAGGIRTPDEALAFMLLVEECLGGDWVTPKLFRIGASALLDNIVEELRKA